MGRAARERAEAELRKRDRQTMKNDSRIPAALRDADSDEDEGEEIYRLKSRRKVARDVVSEGEAEDDPYGDQFDDQYQVNLDDPQGPLNEWITQEAVSREIKKQFRNFLRTFVRGGHSVYDQRIKDLCAANKESLEVSFMELSQKAPTLAVFVADAPTEMLKLFDETAMDVVLEKNKRYGTIHQELHVQITELPICDSIRDIRKIHLNTLIKVSGVVTRRTGVFPQLKSVKYDCGRCGFILGPYIVPPSGDVKPSSCPECQGKGPFTPNLEQTLYRNYQKMTLQESPGTVPAGRLPRTKEVILLNDLIDSARPGEEVEVTGVYQNTYDSSAQFGNGFPVFSTQLMANHISKKDDEHGSDRITEDEEMQIRRLARDPRIVQRIARSIAPSIYGHEDIKTALACSMFGGVVKDVQGKHRVRGDINCLLLGDPGMAKSQFLKYIQKVAHRAVYTTGQGASAVGLTAAVHRDQVTREWTLEGGALVLADNGICMIDEFDKMNDQDRTSIHEAMEQQSISISKAGIVTTLQARCAVVAAANPIRGRYDPSESFAANVNLTEPILSRFDICCVVRDIVDPDKDQHLADHVTQSHCRSHPEYQAKQEDLPKVENADDVIPQDLLKKYILYSKRTCKPKMQDVDQEKIIQLYQELRKESMHTGGHPIAVRHIESIIRMSEAFAKIRLQDFVGDEDVNMAIRVMLESFINSQKFQIMNAMRKTFSRFLTYKKDNNQLLKFILDNMVRDHLRFGAFAGKVDYEGNQSVSIETDEFEAAARELNMHDVSEFYSSGMFTKSFVFSADGTKIVKVFD